MSGPDWTVITPTLQANLYRVMRDNGEQLECIRETPSETDAVVMAAGHPTRCYVYYQSKRVFNNWQPIPKEDVCNESQ